VRTTPKRRRRPARKTKRQEAESSSVSQPSPLASRLAAILSGKVRFQAGTTPDGQPIEFVPFMD
jgi:hypothetical protein